MSNLNEYFTGYETLIVMGLVGGVFGTLVYKPRSRGLRDWEIAHLLVAGSSNQEGYPY